MTKKQHTSHLNGFCRFSSVKAPFGFHFRKDDHYRSPYENGLYARNNESSSPVRGTIDKNEAPFASRGSHMAWIWLIVRALCRNLAFVRCGVRTNHIVARVAGQSPFANVFHLRDVTMLFLWKRKLARRFKLENFWKLKQSWFWINWQIFGIFVNIFGYKSCGTVSSEGASNLRIFKNKVEFLSKVNL